ncbi:ARM REPEAT PROTEIN INTERACTING WITH ABF2 [Tetrabaena socialis]|uniref:ARM REPEAT PROTEIN INTERACTING WITH ABF2 n=1 Tax=Tetrabaena socialis TaxID=47790 RepID=A0A2J7ZST3_9CHLO|nr:ARM REPEAT PROTEIN INTERACTING WITH ABF2 [Tetrabaena socialis]|eukprot:PNH03333.1 ARM REPEAT PROTEIN INTERACTING WITH ABF2 [Tetrabaena socialis]
MHFFSCTVPVPDGRPCGVATRLLPASRTGGSPRTQTLTAYGEGLRPLEGADGLSGLELGPPLQLYADPAAPEGEPAAARRPYTSIYPLEYPVWDPFSSAVYMCEGHAVVRLASDNTVTVVAGDVEEEGDAEGPGRAARFSDPWCLTADGAGSLYVAEAGESRLRKLLLPGVGPGASAAGTAAAGGAADGGGQALAATAEGEVLVSSLQHAADETLGLAFDGGIRSGAGSTSSGSLFVAIPTALYRLPLGDPSAYPTLLAGAEGVVGAADGRGADARFNISHGIALDGEGCVYVTDMSQETNSLRRVAADGAVTTIITGLEGECRLPAILPNGCLAVCAFDYKTGTGSLHVLGLGLKLPRGHAAAAPLPLAAPAGPPPRTLPADLAALLARQPDGTADVTVVVGDRTFHAHRGLLCARSDYFQRLLVGGFAEGSAQQLSLPDADPDAFELWLRFIYTGAADIPLAQAAGVAELADRLLLPELRDQAAAVVEASVSAATVVGLLLWAEACGPAFSGLLSRLKAWYVGNHEAVMREAKEEVRLLAVRKPELFFDLTCELLARRPLTICRAMQFLSCTISVPLGRASGVATRLLPASRPGESPRTQTLVACSDGLRPLEGADGLSGLELGPPLQLYADPAAPEGEPAAARRPYTPTEPLEYPVWDPFSSAVYMCEGHAIVRLASDNTMTVVAGDVEEEGDAEGPGRAARFSDPWCLTADGAGSLYVAEAGTSCFGKLVLPGMGPGASAAVTAAAGGAVGGGGPVAAAEAAAEAVATAEGKVLVSRLKLMDVRYQVWGLAFDGGISSGAGSCSSGSLVFATRSAVHRLPLHDPSADPMLLAGAEGVVGAADGRGADARFHTSYGIALDGEGCVYSADMDDTEETTSLRRVAADGAVTTVITGLQGKLARPAILPNGCLALCAFDYGTDTGSLHVLGLGLKLPRGHAAAAPLTPASAAGPSPRTLSADLSALLARQPDGTADVTIVVGDRTFHAHHGLLCARSDYFQRLLGGGFVEGSAQQRSLPEADPDAFELWLRFIYTGAADIPAAQAAGVAELADRLLLPELRDQAAAVVEASVSVVTVVGLLLWAEARGPAFSGLLSRLKAWYVGNHEAVMREAKEELRLLAVRKPELFFDLTCELLARPW